jgi:hypothetical protein
MRSVTELWYNTYLPYSSNTLMIRPAIFTQVLICCPGRAEYFVSFECVTTRVAT